MVGNFQGIRVTVAEFAMVDRGLFGGKTPGGDEFSLLKALDDVGLVWVTRLFRVA